MYITAPTKAVKRTLSKADWHTLSLWRYLSVDHIYVHNHSYLTCMQQIILDVWQNPATWGLILTLKKKWTCSNETIFKERLKDVTGNENASALCSKGNANVLHVTSLLRFCAVNQEYPIILSARNLTQPDEIFYLFIDKSHSIMQLKEY